jgi:gliding motility-associated-like protein
MFKYWALPVILILLCPLLKADTPVTIRRVCSSGNTNTIYFEPSSDPCSAYFQYKIWGREKNSPFALIDSITVKSQSTYAHTPVPGVPSTWSYFIVITDSCGPDYETYSDTIIVDIVQPTQIFLDSVSIDPLTNKPTLGWQHNPTPDFSYFKVYSIQGTNNTLISSQIDTFYNDNNVVFGPKTYNISSVDSCGNETQFLTGSHTSIFLSGVSDTCVLEDNISWTPYIGWVGIRKYYIYAEQNGGGYILIDSVDEIQTTYKHPIILGSTYRYYIRAFRTGDNISSSSNSIILSTRFRVEPTNSYLSAVSVAKPFDPTTEIHVYNPNEEVNSYTIQASAALNGTYADVGSITGGSSTIQNYSLVLPFVDTQKYFRAISRNACSLPVDTTNTSRYSRLTAEQTGNANSINWEPYFTWNVGVDYYNIYRGTNNASGTIVFNMLDIVSGTDSSYTDTDLPPTVGENGLCYYVEAIQTSGDINQSTEKPLSTMYCVIGALSVYIPNAFNPNGINTAFRPEGSYIDYDHSRMEIYDRWGQQLIKLDGIRSGWNGKDSDGVLCMQGVYLYHIFITSTNGEQKTFKGTVTLLN